MHAELKPWRFKFVNDPLELCDSHTELIRLPARISSKADLMEWFHVNLRFPEYFGRNWDALNDCLHYLDGIDSRRVVLFHQDVPLSDTTSDCVTYLEIIDRAITSWSSSDQHDFLVAFGKDCQSVVLALSRLRADN